MTFGDALERMKAGQHVTRSGWPWPEDVHAAYTGDMQPYLVVQAEGRMAVPYAPNDKDLFADDWEIIEQEVLHD